MVHGEVASFGLLIDKTLLNERTIKIPAQKAISTLKIFRDQAETKNPASQPHITGGRPAEPFYKLADERNTSADDVCKLAPEVCKSAGNVCKPANFIRKLVPEACKLADERNKPADNVCKLANFVCKPAESVCKPANFVRKS
jgi:hypothetical protein